MTWINRRHFVSFLFVTLQADDDESEDEKDDGVGGASAKGDATGGSGETGGGRTSDGSTSGSPAPGQSADSTGDGGNNVCGDDEHCGDAKEEEDG